jgi:hypothetical protein
MRWIACALATPKADPLGTQYRHSQAGHQNADFGRMTHLGAQGANPGRPVRPPALLALLTFT